MAAVKKDNNMVGENIIIFTLPEDIFSLLLEREEGWERNIHVRDEYHLVVSCASPGQGLNSQPRCVPCPGIEPTTPQLWDNTPTNWATHARIGEILGFFST